MLFFIHKENIDRFLLFSNMINLLKETLFINSIFHEIEKIQLKNYHEVLLIQIVLY